MTDAVMVWVVDDDEAIRFVLERALGRAGYQTESFGSVGAVSLALDSDQPAVIITDIRLPDADGLTVLETLKERDLEIPVIAMTAFSDLDQAVSAFQSGVFDYLSKPFDLDKVLAVVARASASSRVSLWPQPTMSVLAASRPNSPAMIFLFLMFILNLHYVNSFGKTGLLHYKCHCQFYVWRL